MYHGVEILSYTSAHAGGVTVSYCEWAQNIQQFQWSEEQVNTALGQKMRQAFKDLRETRKKYQTDMRTAAFALALERVRSVTLQRGIL